MAREWGERQSDGSVVVYRQDDDGNTTVARREPWETNQGQPAAGGGGSPAGMVVPGGSAPTTGQPTASGETTYRMPDGRDYTIEQMRGELAAQDPRWRERQPYEVVTEYQKLKEQAAYPHGRPSYTGGGGGGAGGGDGSAGRKRLVDAATYGNTQDLELRRQALQAEIEDAARRYALAVTAEERNQAYLDLQRWQTELSKIEHQQGQFTDMAKTILSAATQMNNRPEDYVRYNQVVSGGRDIFDVISGKSAPGAAFGGPAGQIRPGSVEDLLGRLGVQYPQTPATPGGVQPGAANPGVTPGQPAGGAAQGAPAGAGGAYPSREERKRGLKMAGWGGNFDDPAAVDDAWWNAAPDRKGKPRPAFPD
jgi:hypothetical protein